MKGLKYLAAYIIPALCLVGIVQGGLWVWSVIAFAFVLVPLLEPVLKKDAYEYSDEEKRARLSEIGYDILLYLNLPVIFGLLFMFYRGIEGGVYSSFELTGLIFSMGVTLGACGINVAHELGHRDAKWEQLWAKALLLPSQYMHFFVEHNRGHHKYIATDQDAASAKYKEALYVFWVRSIVGQYINAWSLEKNRLKKEGKSILTLSNEMIVYSIVQLAFLGILALVFSVQVMIFSLAISMVSILLLETINYVEHYGLRRKKGANGRYETVKVWHSWNSNHKLGRIVLYELTRHSDHHFQSNKKYQILEHKDQAPQLPYGYPSSMLLAMLPPLWFKVMNKKVEEIRSRDEVAFNN